jgi:hypothetical protein
MFITSWNYFLYSMKFILIVYLSFCDFLVAFRLILFLRNTYFKIKICGDKSFRTLKYTVPVVNIFNASIQKMKELVMPDFLKML